MATLQSRLLEAATRFATPLYVYDVDEVLRRAQALRGAFRDRFGLSYAVKANPNLELLRRISSDVETLDVSSYGEVERARLAGFAPDRITFSGPAKRPREVRGAVQAGVGELVVESLAEAELADQVAGELGRRQPVLIRINPKTAPRKFGVRFSGRPSQFGIDEEVLEPALDRVLQLRHLRLAGFHIYSGTNSLDDEAIAENFAIFLRLFRQAAEYAEIAPSKLVFGSGFGVPYGVDEQPLELERLADRVLPLLEDLQAEPRFSRTRCLLELGRWLVAPAGWLLTGVVAAKHSRGAEIRACDAGFNNHLAACGMMGTVIRRNWRFANLSNPRGEIERCTLVGPLCTSVDVLATDLALPRVRVGDVIAVENSGAYGLTASPTRFISHPEPAEVLLVGDQLVEATESALNRWVTPDPAGVG